MNHNPPKPANISAGPSSQPKLWPSSGITQNNDSSRSTSPPSGTLCLASFGNPDTHTPAAAPHMARTEEVVRIDNRDEGKQKTLVQCSNCANVTRLCR